MSKKKEKGRSSRGSARKETPAEIAAGVRAELRSILRLLAKPGRPLDQFEVVEGVAQGEPRYRIAGASSHEAIQDDILALAGGVWHLKDRLKRWAKAKGLRVSPDIEDWADGNPALLVCADLVNAKKHGGNDNRSGYAPVLSGVKFDTSKNGPIGVQYDGSIKESDLLVTLPIPVANEVEILTGDGKATLGDAVELICNAFISCVPLIQKLKVLGPGDPESRRLNDLLARHGLRDPQ